MSATIITFPGLHVDMQPATPIKSRSLDVDTRAMGSKEPFPEKSQSPSDGRRKKDGKSRSVQPNIQVIGGENGRCSYRVQIRKTVAGKSISFTKTFSKLAMASKWKKRKLAEIEIDGLVALSRSEDTVADAITARLAPHKSLGRSAKQQLN